MPIQLHGSFISSLVYYFFHETFSYKLGIWNAQYYLKCSILVKSHKWRSPKINNAKIYIRTLQRHHTKLSPYYYTFVRLTSLMIFSTTRSHLVCPFKSKKCLEHIRKYWMTCPKDPNLVTHNQEWLGGNTQWIPLNCIQIGIFFNCLK